ncbi:phage replisome organizer N-terminal domain-containing protein [Roseburia sp. 831b]|uniref:phage replisome organizer N-terminal domain-containing protein n=1 Tax=Roseburia sp. 831b TaxID=1261635 RepID=UPI000950CDCB|nr:phage replisome organizer N-terminal domain-containing protein [Roseburia sp. 831b]WVK74257.1 phage replisome organizer N-terminal domain-containing protein [Roseburia sp. 831b]
MAENKRYYWLKLMDDFFDSKRIKKLRKMAGGDTYTIIYLKMQLLSLKKGGYLEYSGLEDEFYKEIALDIDEDEINVQVTIQYLLSCGLLETSDNIEYIMPFVQDNLGSETASTRRSRKSRENAQKMLQCNAVEAERNNLQQNCNVEIDTEKDIDTDIEKENTKESSLASSFNAEQAWIDTFDKYPKKSAAVKAKQVWMEKLLGVLEPNRKDVAKLIYYATVDYIKDYAKREPNDTTFRYIPKYSDWLVDDCDYWIRKVEEKQKIRGGES